MRPFAFLGVFLTVVMGAASVPVLGQVCSGTRVGFASEAGIDDRPANCVNLFFCHPPELEGVQYETLSSCDPEATPCSVRAAMRPCTRSPASRRVARSRSRR